MASNSTNTSVKQQLQVCDKHHKTGLKLLRTDIKHLARAKKMLRMVTSVGPSMHLVLK